MSSISPADRADQSNELRRAREEYEEKMAEDTKKHKREMTRVQEKHDQELEELQKNYSESLDGLRAKQRETLTERDEKNIKNVEDLRKLYTEQMKRKTLDDMSVRDAIKTTSKEELAKERKISEQQRSSMETEFKDSIKDRDRNFSEFVKQSEEKIQNTLRERESKVSAKHDEDLKFVREERDNSISDLLAAKQKQKSILTNQIKDLELKSNSEMKRKEDEWFGNYRRQEQKNDSLLSNRDLMLKNEKEHLTDVYRNKITEKQEQMDSNWEKLRDNVGDRVEHEIGFLKNEAAKAKTDRTVDRITTDRLKNLERKNIIRAYEDRMRSLEGEKSQILDHAQEISRNRIESALDKSDKVLQESNRNNKLQQGILVQQSREGIAQLKNEYEAKIDNVENRADIRDRRNKKILEEVQRNDSRAHNEGIEQIKANYAESLSEQREAQGEILKNLQINMEKKFHEQTAKHAKKIEEVTGNYEAKLEQSEEARQSEVKRLQDLQASREKQRDKEYRMQQESIIAKYEIKLNDQEEGHRKDLDRIEKRHQDQMANLTARLSAYTKKA